MSAVDLVFGLPPLDNPADLVFGGDVVAPTDFEVTLTGTLPGPTLSATVQPPVYVTLTGTLPPPTVQINVGPRAEATLTGTLPGLTVSINAPYSSNVSRPVVGSLVHPQQTANKPQAGIEHRSQLNLPQPSGVEAPHQIAVPTKIGSQVGMQAGMSRSNSATPTHQVAVPLPNWSIYTTFEEAIRGIRLERGSRFQDGDIVVQAFATDYQDRYRDRRPQVVHPQATARPLHRRQSHDHQEALATLVARFSRYQEAMRPQPGVTPPVEPPGPEPCYEPDSKLLFFRAPALNADLLFECDYSPVGPPASVIVPIRSVYVLTNTIELRRVSDNLLIPTLGLSLSIDADSWTWGFNASLPASALGDVFSQSGQPIELEANINGNYYRLLVESIARERTFGNAAIRVGGRGKSALLAAPYSPVLTFANSQQRTAQQLMADVLTFNNVPLGWNIDWELEDWLVPAGAFNKQGTYIEGLTTIAGAAGAYLQPHPTAQEIKVMLRYPVAPWDWGTVIPDYEIPAAVMVREGIEWLEKPEYNRVFVSGTSQGVLGQVTREGTAGDLLAPMITDPLITAAAAARQRGLAILGDTGRQARVSLRLPVLTETGIITPGKFVRYDDGEDVRTGIVRSTSVEASYPEVFQSLEVETHL